jgi:hypothetical protein
VPRRSSSGTPWSKPESSTLTSIGDREAKKFLGRITDMIERLPDSIKPALSCPTNEHMITLANGSTIESGHELRPGCPGRIDADEARRAPRAVHRSVEEPVSSG